MKSLTDFLKKRLEQPLPGFEAQQRMEVTPVDQSTGYERTPPSDAVASGVLLLLIPGEDGRAHLVLTVRSEKIEQGGQICLPGGRAESVESPEEAALRETREEIGVESDQIQALGGLTPLYVQSSNSLIHPHVGSLDYTPGFKRDPYEVQEIFTVPVEEFIQPDHLRQTTWTLRGHKFRVPYWNFHDVPLWGATAMILAEFTEIFREFRKNS